MKKIIIRISVLVLVFIGAVFGISKYINRGTTETAKEMKAATLPLVYMTNEGTQLNCLHGYVQQMPVTAMRDTLTPLTSDRVLDIQIQTFGVPIDDIYFEVLSVDGKESLENTKVTKYQEDGEYVKTSIKLQNLILMNQEYVLKLQIKSAGKDIYYYTRILQQDGLHTKNYLSFVMSFYDKCLNKNESQWLASYTEEPDGTGDNSSLASMNIHSSIDQLSWGTLSPQIYYKPVPAIKELNESTASVVLNYIISAKNDDGQQELYNVTEFYRMRDADSKIMLLDFERKTEQIFNPENSIITTKGVNLGITGRDVTYMTDEKQQYFAFVQENELYSYDVNSNKVAQVFTFRQKDKSDYRDVYNRHDISIIQVESNGNIYFTVSGYMNRGSHEGESGVALYYYEAASGYVREGVFVSSGESYELLKKDLDILTYVSDDQEDFNLLIDGDVYQVNLSTMQVEKIVKDIKQGCMAGSQSGKYFAWLKENEAYDSRTIIIMNMDTKETREISCQDSERIRIIGFMGEDLVYGVADASDINTQHEGNELFPMKTMQIQNSQGETVKDYTPGGLYITKTDITEKLLTLTRMQKNGDTFTEAAEDHIVNNAADEDSSFGMTTQVTDKKQTEMILRVGQDLKVKTPQVVRSRQVVPEGNHTVSVKAKEKSENLYYVYAYGKLDSIYANANAAIRRADEMLGVVVDNRQKYVWERGNKEDEMELDITKVPEIMKNGEMDVAKLKQSLSDKTVLDLSGCTLEMVLYYVSHGYPVLVQTSEGVRVMVGYDNYNTILLKPGEEESYYYPSDDSKELFEKSGNIFITYIN
ncbi:hypothetical protein [Robinsoniella peoriensis]|uniref:hypothetical protein n=1 Tax=Robinsoniella peoriensis TaxID=180332 RepID=UPI00085C7153|nr:hypothetical protein [Robinsoniella peoriensis]